MSTNITNEKEPAALPHHFTGTTGRGKAELAVPAKVGPSSSLNEILIFARDKNASDVHLGAQKPIIFRQFGRLKNITAEIIKADQINHLLTAGLPKEILD